MFFLTGVARYLFVPLAEAVVFAMLASYLLSRTLVPTMAKYLLRGHEQEAGHLNTTSRNPLIRLQVAFELAFERFRDRYHEMLESSLHHRSAFLWGFAAVCVGSCVLLVPWLGRDFFPRVDAGQFKLHLRARAGTRIEETAGLCDRIEELHTPSRFRPAKFRASSTTSACLTAASIFPTAIRLRPDRRMPTFWSR